MTNQVHKQVAIAGGGIGGLAAAVACAQRGVPVQLASALQSGASALVTHDRDFSTVQGLPVLMGA